MLRVGISSWQHKQRKNFRFRWILRPANLPANEYIKQRENEKNRSVNFLKSFVLVYVLLIYYTKLKKCHRTRSLISTLLLSANQFVCFWHMEGLILKMFDSKKNNGRKLKKVSIFLSLIRLICSIIKMSNSRNAERPSSYSRNRRQSFVSICSGLPIFGNNCRSQWSECVGKL